MCSEKAEVIENWEQYRKVLSDARNPKSLEGSDGATFLLVRAYALIANARSRLDDDKEWKLGAIGWQEDVRRYFDDAGDR